MMVIWANRKTHHKIHIGREEKFCRCRKNLVYFGWYLKQSLRPIFGLYNSLVIVWFTPLCASFGFARGFSLFYFTFYWHFFRNWRWFQVILQSDQEQTVLWFEQTKHEFHHLTDKKLTVQKKGNCITIDELRFKVKLFKWNFSDHNEK